ncbi:MAG: tyrosine-type recombinase/integrase [Bacteroidales bacterium]|nr:tyrosine-type recombinase/integrase [Bacteroidales bacterium]
MASPIWIEKEKRWSIRTSVNGRIRRFTSSKPGIAGKKEVLRKYRDFTEGHDPSVVLVSDAWSHFLQYVIDKNGRGDSYIQIDKYGRNYILPKIGKEILRNLTVIDFQNVISKAKSVSGKTALSHKTLLNLRSAITQFVKYCVAANYMDPLRGELFIPKNAPKKEKEILQPDDLRRLFSGPSDGDWYINIFRFGCVTGLRTGEILGIKVSDISGGVLTINRSINNRNEITEGKNERARRQIYLNNIARSIIDENVIRNKPLRTDWIFCSKSGGPLSQSTLRNNWLRIAAERDLPGSPYSAGRHTFISIMKNSMPESMLKRYVGHGSSMKTIGGVYDHTFGEELKQAAQIIDINFPKISSGDMV